jgi:hypothetical protein
MGLGFKEIGVKGNQLLKHVQTAKGSEYTSIVCTYGWSVAGRGSMLLAGRLQLRFPMRSLDFSVDLILPAAQWP